MASFKACRDHEPGMTMGGGCSVWAVTSAKAEAEALQARDNMKRKIRGILDPITSVLTSFDDEEDLINRIDGIFRKLDTDGSGGLGLPPPIQATRFLLSNTVSRGRQDWSLPSRKLMVLDIKRAFLHGYCTRSIYVELPESESEGGKYVGKLIRALYGTRDAPLAWQTVVKKDMKELGF